MENLLADLNESYNAKQGKAWGFFHGESGAYPFSGWLAQYMEGIQDFTAFAGRGTPAEADGRVNLSTGGHVLFAHYQQGMTDYRHRPAASQRRRGGDRVAGCGASQASGSGPAASGSTHQHFEWQNNKQSKQYISFIKGKNGKKVSEYFRDFIGCRGGRRCPRRRAPCSRRSATTWSEDLPEEQAREKTSALVDYASTQAKLGEPITLEELSGVIDEDRPRAFYEHIRNKDYGLSPEIPPDKRTSTSSAASPVAPKGCRSASNRTCWARRSNTTRTATC